MKKIKKYFVLALVAAILVQAVPFTVAEAGGYIYEKEAAQLHTIGLYEGMSKTEFVPDLGTKLDRETGIVMLLRLFGQEDEAQHLSEADANAKLEKFTDSSTISDWAKKQVAYAVDKGFVKGVTDKTIAPAAALNGKAYATLILRELGYDVDAIAYDSALNMLAEAGGLTSEEAARFGEKILIKDDLVGMSYGALNAVASDGKKVIDKLIIEGHVDKDIALDLGFAVSAEVLVPAPEPVPAPAPTTNPGSAYNNRDVDDDDDDDDNIVGTGVTSSLEYEQGSSGTKEVYRLTVGEAAASDYLLFTMSIESDDLSIEESHSFLVDLGDAQTVANAVYSSLSDEINQGHIDLGCFGISHENDSVDIIFTADEEAEDRNVDIELKEDRSITGAEFFEDAAGEEVTPGMPPVWERAELVIETGAVRSGTLELQINGAVLNIPVAAGEAADIIAERIYNLLNTTINNDPNYFFPEDSYEIDRDFNMIIFTAKDPGNIADLDIILE